MTLMFICGATINGGALRCPSWISGMIACLGKDFSVKILSTDAAPAPEQTLTLGTKTVKWFPKSAWNHSGFKAFAEKEQADVIVIFGTEHPHALPAVELCRDSGLADKTVLFAQGMACACAKHYAEGVPEKVVRRRTFRDLVRRQNIRGEQRRMEASAADEQKAIELARHFIGRTTLDKAVLKMYNPQAAYYKCNDLLRPEFYEGQWSAKSCERHRIFISQYYYPLKGFHYLLEAAAQLKKKYPDLKIAAAGYNPIEQSLTKRELKDSSYIRYIKSLISRYGLQNNIELTGMLDERQMKEEYLRANVFALPSTIENSPNSLAEAMMLGVPCVASDVGGVSDMAAHREEALLYPASASYLLAYYIDMLFSDDAAAEALGKRAKKRAESDYDKERNIKALENAFGSVAQKFKL